jgi:U3 small nucleolar RNA-associated protein 10
MASLADQLKAIRPSKTGVRGAGGGLVQRPSLLFTPSEAAELDSDAIYSIGISGLAELSKLDPTLTKFEKTLFIRSGTEFRREHQTQDVIRVRFFYFIVFTACG